MLDRVLVDTGPIVALLRPDDSMHRVCVDAAKHLRVPFFTSWPVLTEAAWLLRDIPNGVSRLLSQVENGLIVPLEIGPASATPLRTCLEKYRDLGAQLADASLCYLSEREQINTIFTLDRRDFSVYQNHRNQPFDLVPSR